MIDENKIIEAANKFVGHGPEVDEGVSVSMRRDAFRKGAEWFKNALWHDASEEPKERKYILVQWLYEGRTSYETDRVQSKVRWQYRVAENNIIKWCYIEDILPKGGDK